MGEVGYYWIHPQKIESLLEPCQGGDSGGFEDAVGERFELGTSNTKFKRQNLGKEETISLCD